jgi:hypothetical protein
MTSTADSPEQSARFGDGIQLRVDRHLADSIGARFVLGRAGRGEPRSTAAPRRLWLMNLDTLVPTEPMSRDSDRGSGMTRLPVLRARAAA